MEIWKLYPHHLYVKEVGEAYRDELGDLVEGETNWVYYGECREEGNGSGSMISTNDIKEYKYSSTIYMPKTTAFIESGTMVYVSTDKVESPNLTEEKILSDVRKGSIRVYGQCAKFEATRLHSRMWV